MCTFLTRLTEAKARTGVACADECGRTVCCNTSSASPRARKRIENDRILMNAGNMVYGAFVEFERTELQEIAQSMLINSPLVQDLVQRREKAKAGLVQFGCSGKFIK